MELATTVLRLYRAPDPTIDPVNELDDNYDLAVIRHSNEECLITEQGQLLSAGESLADWRRRRKAVAA